MVRHNNNKVTLASAGGSAVLTTVHQGEGLLCSPLCIRGRVCCARHCASGGGSAVLATVHQGEGLRCSPCAIVHQGEG